MATTAVQILVRIYRLFVPIEAPVHPFDVRYGVDTGGVIKPSKTASGHANDAHAMVYYGTPPSLFQGMLACWQQTLAGLPHGADQYTFVDVGCGKGRCLMLASAFPFRAIVGLELSPSLAAIARANLQVWQRSFHACADIRVLEGDALAYEYPDIPLLLYLFHPFDEYLRARWLERLIASARTRRAPLEIAFVNPPAEEQIGGIREIQLLWTGRIPFDAEDAGADAFGDHSLPVSVYRLRLKAGRAAG